MAMLAAGGAMDEVRLRCRARNCRCTAPRCTRSAVRTACCLSATTTRLWHSASMPAGRTLVRRTRLELQLLRHASCDCGELRGRTARPGTTNGGAALPIRTRCSTRNDTMTTNSAKQCKRWYNGCIYAANNSDQAYRCARDTCTLVGDGGGAQPDGVCCLEIGDVSIVVRCVGDGGCSRRCSPWHWHAARRGPRCSLMRTGDAAGGWGSSGNAAGILTTVLRVDARQWHERYERGARSWING